MKHTIRFAVASMAGIILGTTFPLTPARSSAIPDVRLNEFVSQPMTGEKEWVEIYNASDLPVNLTGWELTEITNPTTNPTEVTLLELSGTLPPQGIVAFDVGTAKLNNNGDSIGLYADEALVDRVTYGNVEGYAPNSRVPKLGMGSARFDAAWVVVATPTKDAPNIAPDWWQ